MVARAIIRCAVLFAALFALAMPNSARAHGSHEHGTSRIHAPASAVKPMTDTVALQTIAAVVDRDAGDVVALSAHHDDTHDCDERGCGVVKSCGACGAALAASYPPPLTDHATGAPDAFADAAYAVVDLLYDGPPPKVLT